MKTKDYCRNTLLVLLSCLGFIATSPAQIAFSNASKRLSTGDYYSTTPVGIADMNADGLDDIIRLEDGKILFFDYQSSNAKTFSTKEIMEINTASDQWSLCIGDVDNNGYNDVLIGGFKLNTKDGVKIVQADDVGAFYTAEVLPDSDPVDNSFFPQGLNLVDVNNDGFLDAFVCNDEGASKIWGNDQLGHFTTANWINIQANPSFNNKGNYSSNWTDFDDDGDLDLYIAKCRAGITFANNPARINVLYVNDGGDLNDGQNHFQEKAADYGLRINHQSWTADFQDIDNDGDLDCFVTNHEAPSQILLNDGTGKYTDITAQSGIDTLLSPYQAVLRDFDNDGFVDILVGGQKSYLYRNNGDRTFELRTDLFEGHENFWTFALGDLNHDGFLDIYTGYPDDLNASSKKRDLLWINEGNANNFLAINLQGTQSNRNGIGARVKIYGEWGVQIREVRSGESYGIHNTFTQHFGLGNYSTIDSVIVNWPSGIKDKFFNPASNQFLKIIEGACISPNANLSLSGDTRFCQGDSLIITAPPGNFYEWSTGVDEASIIVFDSGVYSVTVSDNNKCRGISRNVEVVKEPDETPRISILEGDSTNCPEAEVTLSASVASNYLWTTGETTQAIRVSGAGKFTVEVEGLCQTFSADTLQLETYNGFAPLVKNDTITGIGKGTLRVLNPDNNSTFSWFDQEEGGNLLETGISFTTPVLTEKTTFWVENSVANQSLAFSAGKTEKEEGDFDDLALTKYLSLNLIDNGFRLISLVVYAESAGTCQLSFFDAEHNETINLPMVNLQEGANKIEMPEDLTLPISNDLRVRATGTARLFIDKKDKRNLFPYPLKEFGTITRTSSVFGYYFFFYDWTIAPLAPVICLSDRVSATVVIDDSTGIEEIGLSDDFRVFPNPTDAFLYLESKLDAPSHISIIDGHGRKVYHNSWPPRHAQSLNIDHWPKGIYFIQVQADQRRFYGKVILQ